jgi:general nucleoside transport system ATP-binding protein
MKSLQPISPEIFIRRYVVEREISQFVGCGLRHSLSPQPTNCESPICFSTDVRSAGVRVTAVLELKNISKRFPGVLANDRISFDLRVGEIHSLLGENGAGKTTLMNILYGLSQPDEGEIRIHDQPCHIGSPSEAIAQGIGMVHQHFMLVPTLTVAENIILGQEPVRGPFLKRREAIQLIEKLSDDYCLDVDPNAKVWQLSVGEQQRVEILKVLYRGAEILILDEPTASLTPQEIVQFFDILHSMVARGKSVIFISHKLGEVMSISDRITVLRRGAAIGTANRSDTSETELARMMVGREVVLRVTGDHRAQATTVPVASLQDVSALGHHAIPALREINLSLYSGEILGVAGVDGNGQTELAELLAGLRPPASGEIRIHGEPISGHDPLRQVDMGVYYVPAERKLRGAVMSLPVHMNTILKHHRSRPYSRNGILNHKVIRAFSEEQVQTHDIRCASIDVPAGTLSGGNLQKLILAREISGAPRILIAEQPTRGMDVGAIENVRQLLLAQRDRGAAVLLISADLDEIMALSDRIVVMYEGRIVYEAEHGAASLENIGLAMGGALCQ